MSHHKSGGRPTTQRKDQKDSGMEELQDEILTFLNDWMRGKGLDSTNTSERDDFMLLRWEREDYDGGLGLVEQMISSLIKEVVGNEKVKFNIEDDASGIELDFTPPFKKQTMLEFLESTTYYKFPEQDFPCDGNTAMVLNTLVSFYLDTFTSPTFIVDYPKVACNYRDKGQQRFDLACMKAQVAKAILYETNGGKNHDVEVAIDLTKLTELVAKMSDIHLTEQVFPSEWKDLQYMRLDQVPDLLDKMQDTLNELWKSGKLGGRTQAKMNYLFGCVSHDLVCYIQNHLTERQKMDFWRGPLTEVRNALQQAVRICDDWQDVTDSLCGTDWSGEWRGEKYSDSELKKVSDRLDKILSLRNIHDQLCQLMSPNEVQELRANSVFIPFNGVENVLDVTDAQLPKWEEAAQEYEKRLEPLELRVANKLRGNVNSVANQPHAMMAEFLRYKDLISRPTINQELSSERDALLAKMNERIETIRGEFEHKSGRLEDEESATQDRKNQAGRNMPGVMNLIVWCKQVKDRVDQTKGACKTLLADLPRMEDLLESCNTFLDEVVDYEDQLYRGWLDDVKSRMNDDSEPLAVDTSQPLLKINSDDGRIKVNFSERLVELLKEVRQMTTYGFVVPKDVQKICGNALKFFRHGIALQEVAHLYNTLGDQLKPCHIAMLGETASRFENVVTSTKGKRGVTWSRPDEAEAFIADLKKAADHLTNRNRWLRTTHDLFVDKVLTLYDVDLLRHEDKWMQTVKEMRNKFYELEKAHGFKNMDMWKSHWDYQLYKALQHQYVFGLESLNENLSEIRCELVFKNEAIQFRPNIEVVREKYYHKMKDFISFPTNFKGVNNSPFFKLMPDRNAQAITTVYANAERLFHELHHQKKVFSKYICLGATADLETVVNDNLSEVHQWEANFKMVKQKGKEVNALDNFMKVDCVSISTAPIKACIEDQLQKLGDLLTSSLKKSAQAHIDKIEEWLTDALKKLEEKPQSIDEIGQANQSYQDMRDQKPFITSELNKAEAKAKLLRNVAGNSLDMKPTKKKWDHFQDTLDGVEKFIEQQLEKMKAQVNNSIEAFVKDATKFKARWDEMKPKDIATLKTREDRLEKGVRFVKEKRQEFNEIKQRSVDLINQTKYFGMTEPEFKLVDDLEENMMDFEEMWNLYEEFDTQLWEITQEDWFAFRTHIFKFEDFIKEWGERIKEFPSNMIVLHIRESMDAWVDLCAVLKFLRGDGFTMDHWIELFRLINIDTAAVQPDTMKFHHYLDRYMVILDNTSEIKALHLRAQGEIQIREALQELRTWSTEAEFQLMQRTENGRTVALIKEWKDLMSQVGDNLSLLGSLKESPYFHLFADEANGWEKKLIRLDESLQLLNQIQRRWVYLEPIFSRGALPQEQERFKHVDSDFVHIMKGVNKDQMVISLAKDANLVDKLKSILEQLDRCQKALNEFLEEKRDKFSRFYFIGDDDLLEILGQAQNPAVIQAHLKKLFAGISKVQFDENETHITGMKSLQGEVVPLRVPVTIGMEVETWLIELDNEMRETLKLLLWQCYEQTDFAKYPSQILCLAEFIHFTVDAEKALNNNALKGHKEELLNTLKEYTSGDEEDDKVQQLKMKALILDLIHNVDVIDQLVSQNIKSIQEWQWQKQLRFYFNDKRACILRMVDAQFNYTYEYQGNAAKLVHTPLTDKCYLTLTQGMHLGYGGNPYGPAGTGKTESVKALGNAMGRQVLVFNCDEGIDFKSMGRIFMGLCKCGAWGCFDEFNRLKEDQLSAVSQMIQVIQAALKKGEETVHFLGKTMDLNLNAGIFVTLNPAGKGYGGRSKLPDNLKQLFRAVAMTVPDIELIAETELYSEGFIHAKPVSKRIVAIFKLSRQLLTPQQHYDWGLRALKTILRVAGSLIHSEKKKMSEAAAAKEKEGQEAPKLSDDELLVFESKLLIQSLRVNTLSKLTFEDSKRFNSLIEDVFPGIPVEDIEYPDLTESIKKTLGEMNLQNIPLQVHKILQLYEALNQRMGVVIVGPSGAGKSTLLKVLRKSLQRLGKNMPMYVMNPKAMNREQLLGFMDNDTREWYDGVLTAAARKVVLETTDTMSWILCDGDIDPEWVESLNSVLDDNHLLTMPNGERIQFHSNVNFVFETHSLAFASPATVSRMAVIYLSEEDVDPGSAVRSWLDSAPEDVRLNLEGWVQNYFYKAIDLLKETKALVVDTTMMALVNSGLSHIKSAKNKGQFALGLIRGLGSYLEMTARERLSNEVYKLCGEKPPDASRPLDTFYEEDSLSPSVYQYSPALDMDFEGFVKNEMILTVDGQRNLDILSPWIQQQRPFILVGPEGCGKTMLIHNCFGESRGIAVATVNCSAQTVSHHVIQKLNQVCALYSTNQGRVLRPKEAERLILFLKDLNLPKPDAYATVQLHAFLQQLILYQGFYNADLEWIGVERVQIVGSMNPSGGVGRYPLAPRFTAIVSVCHVGYPPKDQLAEVYAEYLHAFTAFPPMNNNATWGGGKGTPELASTLVSVYDQVKSQFLPEQYTHYLFTPRDLTHWVVNLLNYDMQQNDLLDVIYYEGCRIFGDRLASEEERENFDQMLLNTMSGQWAYEKKDEMYFVSWLDSGASKKKSKKKHRHQSNEPATQNKQLVCIAFKDFRKALDQSMVLYSREYRELDLIEIEETLLWVCRTDRILSQPGGSILMTGRAGVGRRNVVHIAAYMLHMPVYTINMTKDYSLKAFKQDLKNVLTQAGAQNENVCLIIEDHNIVNPTFLEMINSLLSSGEIPGLYTSEELGAILAPLQEEIAADGFVGAPLQYFIHRVQQKLHIAIIMDPTNSLYEVYCQSNPALFTKCAIQWMGTWSHKGLESIPKHTLKQLYKLFSERMQDESKDDRKSRERGLTAELIKVHQSTGDKAATPRMFLQFLTTYQRIYEERFKYIGEQKNRLKTGLSKLKEAEQNVDVLSQDAQQKKVIVKEKQEQADQALEEIEKSMTKSAEQKKDVAHHKTRIDKEKKEINIKKGEVEATLSGIQPTLEAAKKAVSCIKSENLTEIRSLKMPPDPIRDVLEGVLCVMGIYDTSWISMKRFLAQRGVKDNIIHFDAKDITPDIRDSVKSLVESKPKSFEPDTIKKASVAAAPLAQWVVANIQYSTVLEKVGPLQKEMEVLEQKSQKSAEKLAKADKQLKHVEGKIKDMRKKFSRMTAEAEKLKAELEEAEKVLGGAQDLLGKLSGEKLRWDSQTSVLEDQLNNLPKLALLAAAYVTYMGEFEENRRRSVVAQWKKMLNIDEFDFTHFMRTESQLLQYKAEGLPADELSVANSVVILEAPQTALIIDPASQAAEWLKQNLASKNQSIDITTYADEKFSTTLDLGVRFGKTMIITEVDKIEPVLYPILRRDLMTAGPKKTVQVGDKQVDWQDSFQMFLVTRDPNIQLPPDAAALLTVVNFAITRSGLEGQLLGVTIQCEKPELEEQKSKMLQQEEEFKMQLAGLEDMLLRDLSNAEGSLLDNHQLIESLNEIKSKSNTIQSSLQEARELQESLDKERNVYQPFAFAGSVLFFLMKDLPTINHMYQFSLSLFLQLFNEALQKNKDNAGDIQGKIKALKTTLFKLVFYYVCRSLFKEDRLLFGMHMCYGLFPDQFEAKEWDLFMGRAVVPPAFKGRDAPSWMDPESTAAFRALEVNIPNLLGQLNLEDADTWYRWMRNPDREQLPHAQKISLLQQLLIVQCFRPDRVPNAMEQLAVKLLELPSITPPVATLQKIAEGESKPTEPLLLITTPGADPSQELQELAERKVGKEKFFTIAMGGGQTEEAVDLLRKCATDGAWLCLKNLHLVVAWVPQLEKEFNLLKPADDFRLWLTSEPHDKFPSLLLTQSLKITFEAPPGIKKNMMRTYEMWSPEYLAQTTSLQAQILFILAWFHAIVQERRNYIPQGWVKFYEFSMADLRSAADIIAAQCAAAPLPDWQTIYGLFENAIYGGRMDNNADVRILITYLKQFFTPEMLGMNAKNPNPAQTTTPGKRTYYLTKGVQIPQSNKHEDFMNAVSKLSDTDSPVLFSLPPNADRLVQRVRAQKTIDNLNRLGSATAASGRFNREEWANKLSSFFALWKSLTEQHAAILFERKDVPPKALKPISAFIELEVHNASNLMKVLKKDVYELQKVLEGTAILTNKVQLQGSTIMEGVVPSTWDKLWEGPENVIHWLRGAVGRAIALDSWLKRDTEGTLLSSGLNLSELFRPHTFLNALRQQSARESGEALDQLVLDCIWGENEKLATTAIPVALHGLFIQGVKFENGRVADLTSDSPSTHLCPPCTIGWVSRHKKQESKNLVTIYCYLTGTREKELCELSIPAPPDHSKWILTGFGLLLEP